MTTAVVVSCEHAGNQVPARWADLAQGHGRLLESHRGWDPGARELAEELGAALGVDAILCETTRLLVEPNRSLGHPALFSALTRRLAPAQRDQLVESLWTPYRRRVESAAELGIERQGRVLHLSVHSFTPVLDGRERRIDVAALDDPRRPLERAWSRAFLDALGRVRRDLRLALNRPYRGWADGLTTALRQRFPQAVYRGIEIEVSQRFPLGDRASWAALRSDLIAACAAALASS